MQLCGKKIGGFDSEKKVRFFLILCCTIMMAGLCPLSGQMPAAGPADLHAQGLESDSSSDQVRDFVSRFYQVVLGREGETAGIDYWTDSLKNGTRAGADVAWGFIFSQEFTNKDLDNTSFLDVLYSAFFNRQADSGGQSYWLAKLNNGESRQNVLNGFIYSQEFFSLWRDGWYRYSCRRDIQ